ncbi:L-methionine/branched-chain amino acid transporter [Alteromonas gilva]|uniref:L-methionine/branched-chain amino acid transporter n=1 Tax=Alteromonas gilva TaxID=2987522 RepID=A0ABT5L5U2_9ALTE|nr:L-methionine/branched-chain amino acid transporter [Alteromonas gilva]MDC8832422.1 L-methionine/branched-chain amino acid transporter [Alteromonas gilva]
MSSSQQKIGRWHGAGLLTTTLLGTSVFILPQMTVIVAGDWALLTWLLLTLAILPVALVFATLSARYPHAGGPAYFVEKAYGLTAGRTVGVLFLCVVPIGAPAAIIMTYWFVESLFQLSPAFSLPVQLAIIGLVWCLNFRGIQFSAALQLGLTLLITLVVLTLLGIGLLTPATPPELNTHTALNVSDMLSAMGLAFWSFLGIEALSHLAGDFREPEKDLIPAIMTGTLLVGGIYLGCTYLVTGTPESKLAMAAVFDQSVGGYGGYVIGVLGVLGGLATVNVYTASLSRLCWSLSQDGVLPAYFTTLNHYGIPQRALQTILAVISATLIFTHMSAYNLEDLIGWVNGVFVLIYLASMLAAYKLLSRRHRPQVCFSALFCGVIAVGLGSKMLYALGLFALCAPLLWLQQRRRKPNAVT